MPADRLLKFAGWAAGTAASLLADPEENGDEHFEGHGDAGALGRREPPGRNGLKRGAVQQRKAAGLGHGGRLNGAGRRNANPKLDTALLPRGKGRGRVTGPRIVGSLARQFVN